MGNKDDIAQHKYSQIKEYSFGSEVFGEVV